MCCSPDLYRSDDYVVMVTSFNDFANVPGQAGSDGMSAEWRTGAFKTVGGQMKFQTKHAGVLDFGGANPPTGFCLPCLWRGLLTAPVVGAAYYAQKTAGQAYDPNTGRRILFAFTGCECHNIFSSLLQSEQRRRHRARAHRRLDELGVRHFAPHATRPVAG